MKDLIMTDNKNTDDIIDAIMAYPLLSGKVKEVLKTIVLFGNSVSAESIINASNLSKQVVYPALSKLIQADFVERHSNPKMSCYLFSAKDSNVYKIIELNKKTKMIQSMNFKK